jgi:hypothetical protein
LIKQIKKPNNNLEVVNVNTIANSPVRGAKQPKDQMLINLTSNTHQIQEVDLQENIRIILELRKEGKLLLKTDFFNTITVPHFIFEGNTIIPLVEEAKPGSKVKTINKDIMKDLGTQIQNSSNTPYELLCYLDMSEMPEWLKDPELSKEVQWVIKCFSSDTLAFVKNTTKEDHERNLKESWEVNEPGRSEKAKMSRIRYLILEKKERGEKLSQEEESILNTQRERKIATPQEESKGIINSMLKPTKPQITASPVKGGKKGGKMEAPVVEKKQEPLLDYNKILPRPQQHSSLFIKNFLFYTYQNRTLVFDHRLKQEDKQLNDMSLKEGKKTDILKIYDKSEQILKEEGDEFNLRKSQYNETLRSFHQTNLKFRVEEEKGKNGLFKEREDIKNVIQSKKDADKKLQDIIQNENNPSPQFDMNSIVQMYKDILSSSYKSELLERVFNLISRKKEEIFKNDLKKVQASVKDSKNVAIKHLEDVRINNWSISEDLMQKMKDLAG